MHCVVSIASPGMHCVVSIASPGMHCVVSIGAAFWRLRFWLFCFLFCFASMRRGATTDSARVLMSRLVLLACPSPVCALLPTDDV